MSLSRRHRKMCGGCQAPLSASSVVHYAFTSAGMVAGQSIAGSPLPQHCHRGRTTMTVTVGITAAGEGYICPGRRAPSVSAVAINDLAGDPDQRWSPPT